MEHSELFYEKMGWNCFLDSMHEEEPEANDDVYGDWPEEDY